MELRIKKVDQESEIEDFLVPFKISFSMPDVAVNFFRLYIQSRLRHSENESWFVAYVGNIAVSVAAYFMEEGVTMIHSVATLPEFRKRGYARRLAEATICNALRKSQIPIILYASFMGRNLYRSMGFRDVYVMERYALSGTEAPE